MEAYTPHAGPSNQAKLTATILKKAALQATGEIQDFLRLSEAGDAQHLHT